MANLSIKSKLLVMLLAVSLFSIAVVASLNYYTCFKALQDAVFSHLTSVRASRADQIQLFIERLRTEVRVIGNRGVASDAARDFIKAYQELDKIAVDPAVDLQLRKYYQDSFVPALGKATGTEPEVNSLLPDSPAGRYLQYQYLAKNPFPVGEKAELMHADDGSAYSELHEKYHRAFIGIFRELGFIDLYLVEIETGAIVYSMNKEPDFATRLTDGPYAHSNLAELFRRVQRAPDRGVVEMADFEPYRPTLGLPSAFIATPVFDGGRAIAVLVAQLSAEAIDRVMTGGHQWERDGLGKTGEAYLVGPDMFMRSNSRFLIEAPDTYIERLRKTKTPEEDIQRILRDKSTILNQKVQSFAAQQSIAGNEGTAATIGYGGNEVLASWAPLHVGEFQWGIVAKIERDEAYMPMQHMARDTLIQTLLILLVITLVVMFLATSFVRPVNDLIARVQLARTGKTDMTFAAESTDEIGELAKSFRELIGSVQKQTRMLEEATSENQLLLENVMPKAMAQRVRFGQGEITERIDEVTVVFAELKGLAEYTQSTSDNESVITLKRLISAFDEVALRHGVERIKTVGDTYLAVTGLSQPLLDHMRRTVEFALAARAIVHDFNREKNTHLGLTVGIGSGPVIADVMGQGQFLFQLWGAAVIAADHAMDCGGTNEIVVTRAVRDGLSDQYTFKPLQAETSGVPLWTLETRD
ncbi:MAG TPA: adenylate/guanylate cyclase domain-containing protein [Pseudomonadales bacterium]|nr:adenylate/guanylate cyclase domain-containing protein [Pseudomonadales bacterium]